ncbi:haloacid dehalogenase-like hydrolase [Gordonia sp. CPCC 205333]|uniref:haloacid dehalogenase-like hydrolase n=1 Tax=Gordonia sp. CPCC 205333 TaxID=3140790 RepID=UPI003AF3ACC5
MMLPTDRQDPDMIPRRSILVAAAVALTIGVSACSSDAEQTAATSSKADANVCAVLADSPPWYGDNVARINEMLRQYGSCAGHTASTTVGGKAPLALFDWDNTVVRNDIGNATFYWMVAHDKIRQPAGGDWATTSSYLTPDARAALAKACGSAAAAGQPLPTSRTPDCADELLAIYGDATTTDGKDAYGNYNHREMEPAYAWLAQLFAGWTPAEIGQFATSARDRALAAPIDGTETIGTTKVDAGVRYYDQIKNLFAALRANGFDVRIISASPERVVQVWAKPLGFADDKTMGIQSRLTRGTYTSNIVGCGGRADNTVITYIDGKRCRINEQVLGIAGDKAFEQAPADRRQVFAAGDSDTDLTFLSDATGLRLAINRNKTALMCSAYADVDNRWIVNPMFIDPKPVQDKLYACATEGGISADGKDIPAKVDGQSIGDQTDRVHG